MTAQDAIRILEAHSIPARLGRNGRVLALDIFCPPDAGNPYGQAKADVVELPGLRADGTYDRAAVRAWLGY